MADPASVSLVVPAFNEAEVIGSVVSSLCDAAAWREVIVVDDGSTDDTASAARAAGARVVTHPYNKGNGAAVKSGIRAALGDWVLVADGDGQHRPADIVRIAGRLGTFDLVVGARAPADQASHGRRLGNAAEQERHDNCQHGHDHTGDGDDDCRIPVARLLGHGHPVGPRDGAQSEIRVTRGRTPARPTEHGQRASTYRAVPDVSQPGGLCQRRQRQ